MNNYNISKKKQDLEEKSYKDSKLKENYDHSKYTLTYLSILNNFL